MGYVPVIGLIGDRLDSKFWLTPSGMLDCIDFNIYM